MISGTAEQIILGLFALIALYLAVQTARFKVREWREQRTKDLLMPDYGRCRIETTSVLKYNDRPTVGTTLYYFTVFVVLNTPLLESRTLRFDGVRATRKHTGVTLQLHYGGNEKHFFQRIRDLGYGRYWNNSMILMLQDTIIARLDDYLRTSLVSQLEAATK